jgi:hypothetical protein
MSKFQKSRTHKVNPGLMLRPRLNTLFEQPQGGKIDLDRLEEGVRTLMTEVSQPVVLGALVKRMEGTPEGESEMLMSLLLRLKSREVIDYLWQQAKKNSGFSVGAKMTMLVILKGMGEEVDLKDPGLYFDVKRHQGRDIKTVQNLVQIGMHGLARELRELKDPAAVEAYMHHITKMTNEATDGTGMIIEYIKSGEQQATDLDADFLFALAYTTPFRDIRQKAEHVLERMAVRGVKPVTPAILALLQDRFFSAYMTDPEHPWQQSVTVAWERTGGMIQALGFLLDFGVPWCGALKDMYTTRGMTSIEFQRDFVDKSERNMGERLYRVSLERAQATITAAVEANQKNEICLPNEFNEVRHLVERWVLHPAAEALESDSTLDELGDLPLAPDRSNKPVMLNLRDLGSNETALRGL